MKNFIKGFFVGIANITPGISGSALLVSLNLYEKCINSISNIFKDFKSNFKFLFPIAIGVLFGTFLFSNVIFYFYNNYNVITTLVFVGFIFGTIPSLFKEASKKGFKKRYILIFIFTFFIGILFLKCKTNNVVTNINIICLLIIGFIIGCSMIIPGISSTVILSILGFYNIYLISINTLNINYLIPIFIGIALSIFLLSKLINFLLNKYFGYTYFAILGFVISTIPGLINYKIILNNDLIIGLILSIVAFILTNNQLKKQN